VVKVRTIMRNRIAKKSNQKSIQEKRYIEQGADLREKYRSIKKKNINQIRK
jgi:hypothetical protein